MKAFEYKVVPLQGTMANDEGILDAYGAEGWELVAVIVPTGSLAATAGWVVGYLKRPKGS